MMCDSVNDALRLAKLLLINIPKMPGGMTGSMEEGLALTGMGVVGPFTIT